MNPHTDRLHEVLKSEVAAGRSLLVWLKDLDKYGDTTAVLELMQEWMFYSQRTLKVMNDFIKDQPVDESIDIRELDEVML